MADRRRIFTVQDAINAGLTPRSVTTRRQQGAISGIGKMRNPGTPQDPRKSSGPRRTTLPSLLVAPRDAPRYGAPAPEGGTSVAKFQIENPLAPGGQSQGEAFATTKWANPLSNSPRGSEIAALAAERDRKRHSGESTPAGIGALLSGAQDEVQVWDPGMEARVPVTHNDVFLTQLRAQVTGEDPTELLGDYVSKVKGLARDEKSVEQLERHNEEQGADIKIKDSRTQPEPFSTVELVQMNPYGKFTDQEPPRDLEGAQRNQFMLDHLQTSRIDPTKEVEWVGEDGYSRVLPLNQLVQERRQAHQTPVIIRSALEDAYRQGRFKHSPDKRRVGFLKQTMIDRSGQSPRAVEIEVPVFQVRDQYGDVKTTPRDLPTQLGKDGPHVGVFGSDQVNEEIFRVGHPTAYNEDAIRQDLAPYIGVETVGVPKGPGTKTTVTLPQVKAAVREGSVIGPDAIPDGQAGATGPHSHTLQRLLNFPLDKPRELLIERKGDRSQTKLVATPGEESVGPMSYTIMDAFTPRQKGPVAFAAKSPKIRKAAEELTEQSFFDLMSELSARRDAPKQAPGEYREIVNMIADGKLPDDLDALAYPSGAKAGQPMFPRGSHARTVLEQELKTRRNNQLEQERGREVVSANRPQMDFGDDRINEERLFNGDDEDTLAAMEGGFGKDMPGQEFIGVKGLEQVSGYLQQKAAQMLGAPSLVEAPDGVKGQAAFMAHKAMEHSHDPREALIYLKTQLDRPVQTTRDPSAQQFGIQPTEPVNARTMQEARNAEAQQGMADARPQKAVMNTPNISQLNAPASPAPGEVPGAPDPRPADLPDWARDEEDYPEEFGQNAAEQLLGSYLSRARGI